MLPRRLVLVVATLLLLGACGSAPWRPAVPQPAPAVSAVAARPAELRPAVEALSVLRRWDRSRAAAYASTDLGALRSLYGPASWAGVRDVRTLRQYAGRGLAVRGLRMQVLEAEVLPSAGGTVRLRVVDRLAGGAVVTGDSRVPLPAGRWRSRVLTFEDLGNGWVLRSVRPG